MTTTSGLKKPEAAVGKSRPGLVLAKAKGEGRATTIPIAGRTVIGIVIWAFCVWMPESLAGVVHTPPVMKNLCSNCHYVSSLGLSGGGSGGDLSAVMERAAAAGGLDAYLLKKYGAGAEIFFLYPSRYVPQMAIVEGKLFTDDIDRLIAFMQTIPPKAEFVLRPLHWGLAVLTLLGVFFLVFRRLKRGP